VRARVGNVRFRERLAVALVPPRSQFESGGGDVGHEGVENPEGLGRDLDPDPVTGAERELHLYVVLPLSPARSGSPWRRARPRSGRSWARPPRGPHGG